MTLNAAMTLDPEAEALATELESALADKATTPSDVVSPAMEPILVSVDFKRFKGKCMMLIDARPFHAYLDRIGVQYDTYSGYMDRPRCEHRVIDASRHVLSPNVFLCRPPSGAAVVEYDLMLHYTNPPTANVLKAIGESVQPTLDAIIEHYAPVEIQVRVHSKGGK